MPEDAGRLAPKVVSREISETLVYCSFFLSCCFDRTKKIRYRTEWKQSKTYASVVSLLPYERKFPQPSFAVFEIFLILWCAKLVSEKSWLIVRSLFDKVFCENFQSYIIPLKRNREKLNEKKSLISITREKFKKYY